MCVRQFFVVATLVLLTASGAAHAGGPIAVSGDGRPYHFDPAQPVRYVVDAGPLGPRSHEQAVAMVAEAFSVWTGVPTARLRVEPAGELPRDINGGNLTEFLNQLKPGDPSPILFDSDGSIMTAIWGQNARAAQNGQTAPFFADPATGHLRMSISVLNGAAMAGLSDGEARQWIVHELGHFLGLQHSQLNPEVFSDGDPTNDDLAPVMSYHWGPNRRGGLHLADRAWFSWLYPSPDFAARTGSIRGRVLLPDGKTGLAGVQVIARRVDDPLATAVSGATGYRFGHGEAFGADPAYPGLFDPRIQQGSSDPARLGEYLLPGLPPGAYTVEVRPLTDRIPVPRVGFLIGGPKFWRPGSSAQDRASDATPVVVTAGSEVNGIDIVVNGKDPGPPRVRLEEEPNQSDRPQTVDLPTVEILGGVNEPGRSDTGPASRMSDLDDIYSIELTEPTTVTATLTPDDARTDLDLYLIAEKAGKYSIVESGTRPGGSPETVQQRLPPARYFLGVRQAGPLGGGYTLQVRQFPAPDSDAPALPPLFDYVLVGGLTPSRALARWMLTDEAPGVVHYNQPLREIGETRRAREHTLALPDLTPGRSTPVSVYSGRSENFSGVFTTIVAPVLPTPGGAPRIVTRATSLPLTLQLLGRDRAQVEIRLTNAGDGDATNVRIDAPKPAPGWEFQSEAYHGVPFPQTLEVGRIGAGGEGVLVVRLMRRSGTSDPGVTLQGSYTDADGVVRRF
jgi:hypothetical protein